MKHSAFLLGIVALAVVAWNPAPGLAAEPPVTLVFSHQMEDQRGDPIGGIYWLTFALHRDLGDTRILWTEEFPVAVDMGRYQVELGKERSFPDGLPLLESVLSVSLDGRELVRMKVEPTMLPGAQRPPEAGKEAAGGCPRCESAATADNAERLQGMTYQQLEATISAKKVRLGQKSVRSPMAGDPEAEGDLFHLMCPPGFVARGLEGRLKEGSVVSLQVVCSPLEAQ